MEEQQLGSYRAEAHGPITGDEVLPVVKQRRKKPVITETVEIVRINKPLPPIEGGSPLEPIGYDPDSEVTVKVGKTGRARVRKSVKPETLEALGNLADSAQEALESGLLEPLTPENRETIETAIAGVREDISEGRIPDMAPGYVKPTLDDLRGVTTGRFPSDRENHANVADGTPKRPSKRTAALALGASAAALMAAGTGGLIAPAPVKETGETLATVSASMTLAQANANGGIKGRIIWALLNLGREPLITRVYQKAQLSFAEETRDNPEVFSKACHQLAREEILTLVDPDRVKLNFKNPYGSSYQIQCTVRDCYARAEPAASQESAKENAIQEGYVIHGQQAICQKHTHLRDRIRQQVEGIPESRSQRRRRIADEIKQARKENRPYDPKGS